MALHRHRDWVCVRAIDLILLVELKAARKRCVGAEIFTIDLMTNGARDSKALSVSRVSETPGFGDAQDIQNGGNS